MKAYRFRRSSMVFAEVPHCLLSVSLKDAGMYTLSWFPQFYWREEQWFAVTPMYRRSPGSARYDTLVNYLRLCPFGVRTRNNNLPLKTELMKFDFTPGIQALAEVIQVPDTRFWIQEGYDNPQGYMSLRISDPTLNHPSISWESRMPVPKVAGWNV
jgi:hypothetical protein